ncbi:MAG TPA: Holliday junction resolvase RuvX [Ignavibacteria bacterium]|nr:Holliday junction resolvase RuvX [Ignavibacteria bacterium]HMR39705.1 Holliday junction resolvase RuvX [Ignavibacteria bacterium]
MVNNTKYLGIDYGAKRVGIAVSDENKKYSFSRDFMINDDKFFRNLLKLIVEEKIIKIVIGYPLNFKSGKTIQTETVEKFRSELGSRLNKNKIEADIVFFDERLTSKIAMDSIINSGLSKKKRQEKGRVDSISAQIILQDFIDKTNNQNIYI